MFGDFPPFYGDYFPRLCAYENGRTVDRVGFWRVLTPETADRRSLIQTLGLSEELLTPEEIAEILDSLTRSPIFVPKTSWTTNVWTKIVSESNLILTNERRYEDASTGKTIAFPATLDDYFELIDDENREKARRFQDEFRRSPPGSFWRDEFRLRGVSIVSQAFRTSPEEFWGYDYPL